MNAPVPAHYDDAQDLWIFDVPYALPQGALRAAADYVYKVNKDRWLCSSGETRERLGKALRALEQGRYIGRLSGKGEKDLFKSTQGTGKIFSDGGMR